MANKYGRGPNQIPLNQHLGSMAYQSAEAVRVGKFAADSVAVAESANGAQGASTLVAGTVVVANTSVTANSRIFLTPQNASGTAGSVSISARTPGTSFTILSTSNTDTRLVAWQICEPA